MSKERTAVSGDILFMSLQQDSTAACTDEQGQGAILPKECPIRFIGEEADLPKEHEGVPIFGTIWYAGLYSLCGIGRGEVLLYTKLLGKSAAKIQVV